MTQPPFDLPDRAPTMAEVRRAVRPPYEHMVVEQLCIRYGVPLHLRMSLAKRHAERTGRMPQLTWLTWFEQFPGYPVCLDTVVVRNMPQTVSLWSLLDDFRNSQLVERYGRVWASLPEHQDSLGLLFYWPAPRGPAWDGLILHNRRFDTLQPGAVLSYTSIEGLRLYLQKFSVFLKDLDNAIAPSQWLNPD